MLSCCSNRIRLGVYRSVDDVSSEPALHIAAREKRGRHIDGRCTEDSGLDDVECDSD